MQLSSRIETVDGFSQEVDLATHHFALGQSDGAIGVSFL
jgi:hypothetical protein